MEKQMEELKQQLKQQEKLASLGLLSAGIAHEIQNPLNFVINFSKMSNKLLSDLTEIVEDNEDLLISRGKDNEFIPTDICHLVKEYVWLSYHAMRANDKSFNIAIRENYQEGLPQMMVIPQDLSRAVLNIMNNACYAVKKKAETASSDYQPEVTVSVSVEGDQLIISLADNGEGMTEEVKQRLFENFFTTKPIGQGTGLGMAITRDIVENKHGGKLSFESTEGQGTTFTLTIPTKK